MKLLSSVATALKNQWFALPVIKDSAQSHKTKSSFSCSCLRKRTRALHPTTHSLRSPLKIRRIDRRQGYGGLGGPKEQWTIRLPNTVDESGCRLCAVSRVKL